jgi:hypothetical protein
MAAAPSIPGFVQDEFRADAPPLQQRRDSRRPLPAADLFVVAEGEEDCPLRLEPLPEQQFDRLQDAEHARLVVQRAPAPDVASLDRAGEGRVRPVLLRPRLDRNDVHVGHQEDRREARVGPFPGIEEAVARHRLPDQSRVNAREALFQKAMKILERRGLHAAVLVRNGGEADGGGQPLRGRVGVYGEVRHRLRLDLAGLDCGRPHEEDGDQEKERGA